MSAHPAFIGCANFDESDDPWTQTPSRRSFMPLSCRVWTMVMPFLPDHQDTLLTRCSAVCTECRSRSHHWHTQVRPTTACHTCCIRDCTGLTSQNVSTTNRESQCIAVCRTRSKSTWLTGMTAVHQSQTFLADVIYGQPHNITWLYHVTGSALSVIGPSLMLVWWSRTRYRTVSTTWCSPATTSDNRWKRTYFVATTQHTQYSRDASWLLLYKSIIDIDTKPRKHHKMSTVRPDTSRETATPLIDGCNNNRMVQLSVFH